MTAANVHKTTHTTHADARSPAPTRSAQPFNPPIRLSDSDFLAITEGLGLAEEGRLREEDFARLFREQLQMHAQARLSGALEFYAVTERDLAMLGTLKHVLMAQARGRGGNLLGMGWEIDGPTRVVMLPNGYRFFYANLRFLSVSVS